MKIKTLLFLFICLSLSACKDDDAGMDRGYHARTLLLVQ